MARQVLQVKRKNSTNCSPPDARLTAVGSVAWSSGPREVATGRAVASSLGAIWVAGSSVEAARVGDSVAAGGFVADASGAHAANKATIRRRINDFFILFPGNRYSIKSLSKYYKPPLTPPSLAASISSSSAEDGAGSREVNVSLTFVKSYAILYLVRWLRSFHQTTQRSNYSTTKLPNYSTKLRRLYG